jgi:phosphonate transport system permease protein
VRSATTLGIVGAGGIGQTLYESIRSFQYAETAAQVIIVVVTVVAIDMLSSYQEASRVGRVLIKSRLVTAT